MKKVAGDSDRLMFLKVSAHSVDILVVEVYMPTSNCEGKEVKSLHGEIEGKKGKGHHKYLGRLEKGRGSRKRIEGNGTLWAGDEKLPLGMQNVGGFMH